MDLQFQYNSAILFSFLAVLLVLINKWRRAKQFVPNQRPPPGPWKLPLIGSLHHLIGSLPHRILRDLARKHGPLMHLQLGEVSAVVVSSPRIAEVVMKTHDLSFASRPQTLAFEIVVYNYRDVAFCPYGDYWRQMRKICVLELLSAKNVRSFSAIRHDEASRLIASVQVLSGKPINLRDQISSYTSSMVCRAAFGKIWRSDQSTLFAKLVTQMAALAGGFDLADLFPSFKILQVLSGMKFKLLKIHNRVDRILEDIIDGHIEATEKKNGEYGEEDLIDILLRIRERDELQFPITETDIKAILFDMFAAGTETSTTTVEWTLSAMMRYPHVMAKAQTEIRQAFKGKKAIDDDDILGLKYLKLVIKETLRLYTPFPLLLPRECREDCEVDGYSIPMKSKVIINAWAMARDTDYWEDPESFKPERFEHSDSPIDFTGNHFQYIPFGAGRRMCPGMSFGLANVELPLALLLYHFNWELPAGVNEVDMTETSGITAPRKYNLHLVPTLCNPSQ